jgi:hypothetical protein
LKAIYLSAIDPTYSRSGVYFAGDRGEKEYIRVPHSKLEFLKIISNISSENNIQSTVLVVMSPNHVIVPWLKLFTNFRIILDAGWPLSDSLPNISPKPRTLQGLKNYFIDYISFKLADTVIVESNEQLNYVSRKFSVDIEKLHPLFTGFNESEYATSTETIFPPIECQELEENKHEFVLFRGKFNLESGIELILQSARDLEKEVRFVIVTNRKFTQISENTIIISRFLKVSELVWLYRNASAVLGQFSDQNRLARTIPHKAFEAAYFAKCYLSPPSKGLQGFLNSSQFIAIDEISREGIVAGIRLAMSNEHLRLSCATAAKKRYTASASQEVLSEKFRKVIESS